MKILKPLTIVAVIMAVTVGLIVVFKEDTIKKYTVVLEDNTTFKAYKIVWYASGMADIKKCNGERIQLPIRSIKEIKYIKAK